MGGIYEELSHASTGQFNIYKNKRHKYICKKMSLRETSHKHVGNKGLYLEERKKTNFNKEYVGISVVK